MIKHDWDLHKAGRWAIPVDPRNGSRGPYGSHLRNPWIHEVNQKFHSHLICRNCDILVFMNYVPTSDILGVLGIPVDCGLVIADLVLAE